MHPPHTLDPRGCSGDEDIPRYEPYLEITI